MKFNETLVETIRGFYFPLHFAVGCFYFSGILLGGKEDCRGLCTFFHDCADSETLLMYDWVNYLGIGLLGLSFVLPSIMLYRQKKIIQAKLFS